MKYRDVKVKLGPHYENKFPAKIYGILEKTKFSNIIACFPNRYIWKVMKKNGGQYHSFVFQSYKIYILHMPN